MISIMAFAQSAMASAWLRSRQSRAGLSASARRARGCLRTAASAPHQSCVVAARWAVTFNRTSKGRDMNDTAGPVIKSFSQSTRDRRCLEVWFDQEVSDAGREWLLEAINEKAQRDCLGWSTMELLVPNLGWSDQTFEPLNAQATEHPPSDNPHDPFAAPGRTPRNPHDTRNPHQYHRP